VVVLAAVVGLVNTSCALHVSCRLCVFVTRKPADERASENADQQSTTRRWRPLLW